MCTVGAGIGGLRVLNGLATNGLLVEVAPLPLIAFDQLLPLAVGGLQVKKGAAGNAEANAATPG